VNAFAKASIVFTVLVTLNACKYSDSSLFDDPPCTFSHNNPYKNASLNPQGPTDEDCVPRAFAAAAGHADFYNRQLLGNQKEGRTYPNDFVLEPDNYVMLPQRFTHIGNSAPQPGDVVMYRNQLTDGHAAYLVNPEVGGYRVATGYGSTQSGPPEYDLVQPNQIYNGWRVDQNYNYLNEQ